MGSSQAFTLAAPYHHLLGAVLGFTAVEILFGD
jgi:hypothetical protein